MTKFRVVAAVPTMGRTFLLDMSDEGPTAEFRKALGIEAEIGGMVGAWLAEGERKYALGQQVFWLEADFEVQGLDEATKAWERVMTLVPDAKQVWLSEWVPTGSNSAKTETVTDWKAVA